MSDFDFDKCRLETNEALLERVVAVLNDIKSKSTSDIQSALLRAGSNPIDLQTDSIRLLYCYQWIWRPHRGVSFFLSSSISNPLRALIRTKADLEDAAINSALYRTALEIVEECMTCLEYREQLREHKTTQRRILSNNRSKFFEALVLRNGKQCAHCKSKRKKLLIDHIKPVTKGGVTELVNLQLLCFVCNSEKSDRLLDG